MCYSATVRPRSLQSFGAVEVHYWTWKDVHTDLPLFKDAV